MSKEVKRWDELKALAEAAKAAQEAHLSSDSEQAYDAWAHLDDQFSEKATSATVLDLLADYEALLEENQRLESAWKVDVLNRKDELIAKQEKENDRVKAERDALLAELDRLREALNALRAATPSLTCESFHHERRDLHDHDEECPPFERWIAAALACNAALQGEQP